MSQKNILIFTFLVCVSFMALFFTKASITTSINDNNSNLLKLQKEVNAYNILKNFDNTMATLKVTLSKLSGVTKPSKVNWQKDKVEIIYTSIPKNLIDRIMQTFIKQGHIIESFSIKNDNQTMSLELRVSP